MVPALGELIMELRLVIIIWGRKEMEERGMIGEGAWIG